MLDEVLELLLLLVGTRRKVVHPVLWPNLDISERRNGHLQVAVPLSEQLLLLHLHLAAPLHRLNLFYVPQEATVTDLTRVQLHEAPELVVSLKQIHRALQFLLLGPFQKQLFALRRSDRRPGPHLHLNRRASAPGLAARLGSHGELVSFHLAEALKVLDAGVKDDHRLLLGKQRRLAE